METNFPEWLQAQMNEHGFSAAELARKSGISTPQISRLLTGQRGVSEVSLRAIAEALGIPPETAFRVAGFLPPQCRYAPNNTNSFCTFSISLMPRSANDLGYDEFLTE